MSCNEFESSQNRRYSRVALHAIADLLSVFCFYQAVQETRLAEANILNMTYPVFIVVLGWWV